MPDLLDVNVWVSLSIDSHPAHHRAKTYWADEASQSIVFCRLTALGLVRVCSGKTALGGTPLPMNVAWKVYLDWRNAEGVELWEEPDGIDLHLASWIRTGFVTPRLVTDAYLAAFAIRSGARLVTFDSDFERFSGLDLLHLKST